MSQHWYRFISRVIVRLYFSRLTLLHAEGRPRQGQPALYVGLHRNGAVDGFVYSALLDDPTFLISTQLTDNWFARLFFHGITVTREKDRGNRQENDVALNRCVEHMRAGKPIFIFPEGTSSLGPEGSFVKEKRLLTTLPWPRNAPRWMLFPSSKGAGYGTNHDTTRNGQRNGHPGVMLITVPAGKLR